MMLLVADMMPSAFICCGDGHLLQHDAVRLPGRMPTAGLSVCLDIISVLEEADGNSQALKFLYFKRSTCPVLCVYSCQS